MRTAAAASSRKAVSALVLAVAAGVASLGAPSVADAAPFLTVSLVGRVQGSGEPFSSTPVVAAGDTVEYEVRVQLGAEDSVNLYAGTSAGAITTTISNWIPSNGATSPTAGLNQLRFNIQQAATPGALQVDFDTPAIPAPGWADAPGASPGTVAPRGNGNDDLDGINLTRAPGNFDGVAGTPVANDEADPAPAILELLTVATGVFDVVSGGNLEPLMPTITGGTFVGTTVISTFRWRNDANNANVNYNTTASQQNNSTIGAAQGGNSIDPIVVYEGLFVLPEPSALGPIALAALAGGRRRRRPGNS